MKMKALLVAGTAVLALGAAGASLAEAPKYQFLRAAIGVPHPPVLSPKVVALKVVEQGYDSVTAIRLVERVYVVEAWKGEDDRVTLFVDPLTGIVLHEAA